MLAAALVVLVQGEPEGKAATSAEQLLSEGTDYQDATQTRLFGPVEQAVSFRALVEKPGQRLVITRIEVTAFALAEFDGTWAVLRDASSSGAGYRECLDCTDGGQSLSVVLADSENGYQEMPLNPGSTVEVRFTDDISEDYSRYEYEVYGYYEDAAATEASDPETTTADTAAPVAPAEPVNEPEIVPEEAPLTMLVRSVMPFSLMTESVQPMTLAAVAAPTYASPWANNPGPLASSTHTLTANTSTRWTENFSLGGSTGALVSTISYRYTTGGKTIQTTPYSSFVFSIDGIIDTSSVTNAVTIYANSRGVISTVRETTSMPVGYRYPIMVNGVTAMYVDAVVALVPGTQSRATPAGFDFTFRDLDGNPMNMEIPANTATTMTYTWTQSPGTPVPTAATLTVTGASTGVTEPTTPPGGSDSTVGKCSTSGGTVWVGMSAHTNASQTFNDRNTTQLYRQVYGSTTFEKVGATTNWVYNALAYNPKDGYLYAISQGRIKTYRSTAGNTDTYDEDRNYPAGHLLRVSPENGSVMDLGFISGIQAQTPGTWPNDLWGGITSGVITADGRFIFSNSSQSGTHNQYVLDLTRMGTSLTATRINANLRANDYTFFGDSSDGYIYGMRNGTTILERVNLATGAVTTFDMAGQRDALGNVMTNAIYGTAWTYPNGNLGFGRNDSQLSYQIEVYDSTASGFKARLVSVAPAPTSQSNDAASNALVAGDADLGIEKKLVSMKDGEATWEITVSNLGPCGSSGFNVTDVVPTGKYSNVRFEFLTPGWVSTKVTSTTNGNTLVALHGPLEVGQTATLRLKASYDPSASKCVENTASVFGNEKDPTPGSNTDSDSACALKVTKDVVDINSDGVIDAADGNQPGPKPDTRQIQYSITVTNPDTVNANKYTLTDTPRFSGLVTVTGGQVTRPDGSKADLPSNGGPYTLATDKKIEAGATETYLLTVYYTPPAAGADMATAVCTEKRPGNGLYNEAKITFPGGEETDDGCAPIAKEETVTLFLRKVGTDNRTAPLTGAKFVILDKDRQKVADMSAPDPANGDFYSATSLKKGTTYFLVETQSPTGYSLLPQPVEFTITSDAKGNAQVAPAQNSAVIGVVEGVGAEKASPSNAFITLADFRQGDLPKTGGLGYAPWVLGATILMLLGAAAARRKDY